VFFEKNDEKPLGYRKTSYVKKIFLSLFQRIIMAKIGKKVKLSINVSIFFAALSVFPLIVETTTTITIRQIFQRNRPMECMVTKKDGSFFVHPP